MKPYYERGGITIYHGDCREILPQLDKESVDLVLTDPPYGIGFDYGTGYMDDKDGYIEWLWPIVEQLEILLRPGGRVAIFQAAKNARMWATWFPRPWRLLALPKLFSQVMPTDLQWATDYVLTWGGPEKHETVSYPRDWFLSKLTLVGRDQFAKQHPCPRPLDTMRFLVDCLSEQQSLVLDPFVGSGTTLRAAKDLGRRAIGIEIEEKYCEIAVKRLAQEVLL